MGLVAKCVEGGEEFGGAGVDVVKDLFFLKDFGNSNTGSTGYSVTGIGATL